MTPGAVALQAGLRRGWIEFRHTVTNPGQLVGWLFWPAIALVVMYFMRDSTVPGTDFSLGTQAVAGILGINTLFTGLVGLAFTLITDREDGTLLRAKATPNGMLGYVTGKVLAQAGITVAVLIILLVPVVLLFDGLSIGTVSSWVTLVWVLALGMLAILPVGAILGSLFRSTQGLVPIMVLIMALVGVSGVFYPLAALPEWLQWLAQVFPVYWLGLGLRAALLPDAMAVAEIGESWRYLEMIGVLGIWGIVGFLVAPGVLRRMARRESGSAVAARRESVARRAA
ncbi:ABC transporter permease [Kibdelosporangium phytohabitans]|uniref:ABC transporter n=1 Tax=Kibdelosporangium phytohabitans TaxID=860235 RepID=A0A0N9I1Q1_9PSEU|nr:ABC transporter permease [Kibdelosporangium phytohabitans]ALG08358.1 ABC transporter [Kibdelosporangium phytohabitans]MBE1470597.1 ABC-2 type transport system permease protein [Kibdelosporangium phytohabitans]